MSRIGKKPISIPKGVTVTIKDRELEVKGAKGVLKTPIPEGITFVKVDPSTGLLNTEQEDQPGNVEIFARGSEPTQAVHRRSDPMDFYKIDQPE